MRWYQATLITIVLAGSAAPGLTIAASLLDDIDTFVHGEMEREKIPGVAIGIVRDGTVIAEKGYGYANVENRVLVKPETVFQSGSLGKQFTSVAVMLQVEDHKLALDDPITKYFTDAPPGWRRITIRHLLTHTSGIPDYEARVANSRNSLAILDYRRDYTEDDLAKIAYALPLEFEPGSRWHYSNTGYVLLGILVHKVTGRFYGDVLRDRVFRPLGMKSARIISEEDIVPNRAAGYRLVNGDLKNQEWVSPVFNTTADGSLYLSIIDFIAWSRGLEARSILKPLSWSQIYTPVVLKSGRTYPYGMGWFVDEAKNGLWYHHSGAWQGFKTYISRYLADDLTIIVLANLADATPQRFIDGISSLVDPTLPKLEPATPIDDKDPVITERLRRLLKATADGSLVPGDLPDVRSGFEELAKQYQTMLGALGTPQRFDLLERRELGDDRVFTYAVMYHERTLRVRLGLSPDDRISIFELMSVSDNQPR